MESFITNSLRLERRVTRWKTSAIACGTIPGVTSSPIMVWVLPEEVTP